MEPVASPTHPSENPQNRPRGRLLVVDDDDGIRSTLVDALSEEGHEVGTAATGAACLAELEREPPDVVLLDYRLPDAEGLELLIEIQRRLPDTPVVMLTGQSRVEVAVEAMRSGAFHFLTKPLDLPQIANVVQLALEATRLRRALRAARRQQLRDAGLQHIVGESATIEHVKQRARRFAQSRASTILVTGESGTGKDLLARAIHAHSSRAEGPFVNITCSALPENLLESELFGHEKGAFTGALQQKKGLLEQAHGGTVFLDEIGEMAPALQAKLLRFLESKTFRRVGGNQDLQPDVRIITATNRELKGEVRSGRFREDLFYRLTVLHLHVPSLRERRSDVPLLLRHFVDRFAREFHQPIRELTPSCIDKLTAYAWPGNVRELRNAVERAVLLADGEVLGHTDFELLGVDVPMGASEPFELPAGGVDLAAVERSLLVQALQRTGGNQSRAAGLLGINRDQVRYRVAKFGLDLSEFSQPN